MKLGVTSNTLSLRAKRGNPTPAHRIRSPRMPTGDRAGEGGLTVGRSVSRDDSGFGRPTWVKMLAQTSYSAVMAGLVPATQASTVAAQIAEIC